MFKNFGDNSEDEKHNRIYMGLINIPESSFRLHPCVIWDTHFALFTLEWFYHLSVSDAKCALTPTFLGIGICLIVLFCPSLFAYYFDRIPLFLFFARLPPSCFLPLHQSKWFLLVDSHVHWHIGGTLYCPKLQSQWAQTQDWNPEAVLAPVQDLNSAASPVKS